MSGDYRPRGAGGSSAGGGGRRRRGGRGRSGPSHSSGEHRSHTNGHSTTAPKKKEGLLSKFLGLFKGNKSKPEAKAPYRATTSPSRPEYKERTPGAERVERRERPPREDRPPKADPIPQEIVSPKLYVGNLAYEAAESDLFDLFSKIGAVKNVEVAMDRRSNRSKGFGFVEMESLDTAKAAAEKLNRTDFMGRQIVVSGAKVEKRLTQSSRDERHEPEAEANPAPQQEEHHPETGGSSSSSPDTTV